jgi:putative lipoic acid-binding regulatory protein
MAADGFENRDIMRRALNLPGVVTHCIIGDSSDAFQARVHAMMEDIAPDGRLVRHSYTASTNGRYISYRYDIYHETLESVEEVYRRARTLEGVRFML